MNNIDMILNLIDEAREIAMMHKENGNLIEASYYCGIISGLSKTVVLLIDNKEGKNE